MSVKIIGEIGINHNGSLEIAKKLIDIAAVAGCDYVKFQKRNPEVCVPQAERMKIRQTPWGEMTYIDYKHKIEFGKAEFDEIDAYCRSKGIGWFASVWDTDSVEFCKQYKTQLDGKDACLMKIPSALITETELCKAAQNECDYLMISTGMSTQEEIDTCVKACNPQLIFHTNSTYPSPVNELNLSYIQWLKDNLPSKEIGYSGHEFGLVTTFAAVALGATWVERHITLDRTMWGSDHMASIEPTGLIKLVKGIRDIEKAVGGYGPRNVLESEKSKRSSLRG